MFWTSFLNSAQHFANTIGKYLKINGPATISNGNVRNIFNPSGELRGMSFGLVGALAVPGSSNMPNPIKITSGGMKKSSPFGSTNISGLFATNR